MRILFVLVLFVAGCPHPQPGPGAPTSVIDCTKQAVRDHGIGLIPQVNDCLVGIGGWAGCLLGLVQPAVGITEDVLACAVRSSGQQFAAASLANGRDSVSAEGTSRAKDFIRDRGYKFQ